MAESDKTCVVRTKHFMTNPLLQRKQMLIDVVHHGRPNVPKNELRDKIGKIYKVQDPAKTVFVYGMKTAFGGGRSTGFCLIYDNEKASRKFEPKYRLVRAGMATREQTGRKQRKEKKNRTKKVRGTKKAKVTATKK